MIDFVAAAKAYFDHGWVAIPLGLDTQGFPKRPLPKEWPETPRDWSTIEALPWGRAAGLGIILGPRSGGLCAIDVDDVLLADKVVDLVRLKGLRTRIVRTVRNRLHLFVQAKEAMDSHPMKIEFDGREVTVELKGKGTQVAAPPTPGYTCIDDSPPIETPTLFAAWASLRQHLGLVPVPEHAIGNYPSPWSTSVKEGARNDSLYVEAHRLREAGVPLDTALHLLSIRVKEHYEGGSISWIEAEGTIRSAYRKGVPRSGMEGRYGIRTTDF